MHKTQLAWLHSNLIWICDTCIYAHEYNASIEAWKTKNSIQF